MKLKYYIQTENELNEWEHGLGDNEVYEYETEAAAVSAIQLMGYTDTEWRIEMLDSEEEEIQELKNN